MKMKKNEFIDTDLNKGKIDIKKNMFYFSHTMHTTEIRKKHLKNQDIQRK